jgi:hypothetical protein
MPTLEASKAIVEQILAQYDAEKGLRRKLAFFLKSRSDCMSALDDWLKTSEDIEGLSTILHHWYEAYFKKANFIYDKQFPFGADLSFRCLVRCDNEIFSGEVIEDIVSPNLYALTETNLMNTFCQKGLMHFLPDSFLNRLSETSFFTLQYSSGNTGLAWAIANGRFLTAAKLIALSPVESLFITDSRSYGGKTVLAFLVAKGSDYRPSSDDIDYKEISVKPVFDELMKRDDIGVDLINAPDRLGNTPLHIAFLRRDKYMIERLIEKGGDLTLKNHTGQTPEALYQAMNPTVAFNYISKNYFGGEYYLFKRVPNIKLDGIIEAHQAAPKTRW